LPLLSILFPYTTLFRSHKQNKVFKVPRIDAVDALRGFAVIAILLVHSVEHFIFPVYPDPEAIPNWLNILDEGVFSVVFSLFAGRSEEHTSELQSRFDLV